MKNIIGLFFTILLFLTENNFAYSPEEGNVTASFGAYLNKTNFSSPISSINSSYLDGMGLIALGDINQKSSLEIAMFYMPQLFFRHQMDHSIVEKTQLMHISMGYRRWLNQIFSTSLAFYSSYSMGNPQTLYNDFPMDSEINTSARDITEYGVDWAFQGDLWSHEKLAVTLEGRYSRSMTNKENEKSDQYGFFLGIRYLIQEKK